MMVTLTRRETDTTRQTAMSWQALPRGKGCNGLVDELPLPGRERLKYAFRLCRRVKGVSLAVIRALAPRASSRASASRSSFSLARFHSIESFRIFAPTHQGQGRLTSSPFLGSDRHLKRDPDLPNLKDNSQSHCVEDLGGSSLSFPGIRACPSRSLLDRITNIRYYFEYAKRNQTYFALNQCFFSECNDQV